MPRRANINPMNVALRQSWTAEQFLAWASTQEGRYEFDGLQLVAMTGGTARHSTITNNIQAALRPRLRGSPCRSYGPDLGVRTVGETVRSPDAVVSCTKFPDMDTEATNPVVIFEVLSPSTARTDRIEKMEEYALVPSIRRYVIIETRYAGLLVLHRENGNDPWTALPLKADATLDLPELSISVSVQEFYQDITFEDAAIKG